MSARRLIATATAAAVASVLGFVPGGRGGGQPAAAAAPAASYTYDASGRLVTVTTAAGMATYSYDKAGNITAITRSAARSTGTPAPRATGLPTSAPRITSVAPMSARPGDRITITGTGFSPEIAADRVRLGDLQMEILTASATRIEAIVPPAADSGKITVSTLAGSASHGIPVRISIPGDTRIRVPELEPLAAPRGVTAIAGRALSSVDGTPLAGVRVTIDGVTATSDDTGRFLVAGVSAGKRVMAIDGTSVHGASYGLFTHEVTAERGRTTALTWKTWLTPLDTSAQVRIGTKTTRAVVVTTPKVPGLEVRIPKGTTIRDHAGKIVDRIGITKIPIERPPFPLPPGVDTPVYFTVQPGGALIAPKGAQIVYPNTQGHKPGKRLDFWNYDATHGWYVYGKGTVSKDGTQIVPDRGVAVYEFTGAMFNGSGMSPPGDGPDDGSDDGDPVNLATGLFVHSQTDLSVNDIMPIEIARTYRQNDPYVRRFGLGMNDPYGMFLWSAAQYQEVDLVLDSGARVHFVRTSPGTGYTDAIFDVRTNIPLFAGARMTWNGNGWDLKFKNGSVWLFGENAPLQGFRDRWGNTVTLTRTNGQRGDITRVTSPNGKWIAYTYDTGGKVISARDNIGRTVGYRYDTSNRMIEVTNPAGKTTTFGYDANGRMSTVTDARGITFVKNTYDTTSGRVSRQETPDGGVYLFTYATNASGAVVQTDVTAPNGSVRRVTFDTNGQSLTDTRAAGTSLARTTTYERDASGWLTATVDPQGRRTTYSYDAKGNTTSMATMVGTTLAATTSFTFEPAYSRTTSVTDGLGHKTTWTYDDAASTVKITDPMGHAATTELALGQPIRVTDAEGNSSTMSYLDGDLVATNDPLDNTTTRITDGVGRILKSIDAEGAITTLKYDLLSHPVSITDPMGTVTSMSYDDGGNLLQLKDGAGRTTSWTYDDMNQVASRKDGVGKSEYWTYTTMGQVATYQDRMNRVDAFTYDALGRLWISQLDRPSTGTTYVATSTRTYSTRDDLSKITDTGAGTLNWTYDLAGRTLTETGARGKVTYTYDKLGRRSTMTAGTSPQVVYTYDNANNLITSTQASLSTAYTYDSVGRPLTQTLPNGLEERYTYDAASRLVATTIKQGSTVQGTLEYGYDAVGRLTSQGGTLAKVDLPEAVSSAIYNPANRLTSWNGSPVTTNANGQILSALGQTYTWTVRGLLGKVSGPVNATYTYDALDRRATSSVGGVTKGMLNDGAYVVQEQDAAKARVADVFRGGVGDRVVSRTDVAAGATKTFLSDRLSSTVAITGATGAIETSYGYTPFGKASTSGAATTNAYQFTGLETDATGLQYSRARYYHPGLQRFLSEDPAGVAGGQVNQYSYVGNSPGNATDPSGAILDTLLDIGFIAYDVYKLFKDGRKNLGENLLALGLDVAGAAIPFATGLGGAGRAAAHADDVYDAARAAENASDLCRANSFTADTEIAMADGSTKRIDRVQVGDTVLASDPESGQVAHREVTDVIVGTGLKSLVDIVVDGDVVSATDQHPFWSPSRSEWIAAKDLRPGDLLVTAGGDRVAVLGVSMRSVETTVFNLTVDVEHTFFVTTTAGALLVHNCIRNSHLAGQNHPVTDVPFDKNGFPDFSNWRHPDVPDVTITPTGNRAADFAAANAKAGLPSTPDGYTWHHHQDTGRMQLVESGVHAKTGHTGGFSLW